MEQGVIPNSARIKFPLHLLSFVKQKLIKQRAARKGGFFIWYNRAMFADKVEINVQAGKGGDGRLSFRREKYRAMGGPDGGDGGRGGSVIFVADHNLNSLAAFRKQKLVKAEDGQIGGTNRSHGKSGENIIVKVPMGTQIFESETLLADLAENEQSQVVAKGGRGGFGNAHFTSSTRQAPRAVEVGEPGEHRNLVLEMKMVADVGLVGLPNAGKSTLLSVITNAKPEIADYPFTTIIPNLGVVYWRDDSFLVADIPGLIEGASEGKGLGDDFLRHIERTAVIIHLVDANSNDVAGDYKTILQELKSYTIDLSGKPQLVALSKADLLPDEELYKPLVKDLKSAGAEEVLLMSSSAHKGLDKLLDSVAELVGAERERRKSYKEEEERVIIDEASQPDLWRIEKTGNHFEVKGEKIEGFARRTNWNQEESVDRFRDILRKTGVAKQLEKEGAQKGDRVVIAGFDIEW